jgi:hypothetical protein
MIPNNSNNDLINNNLNSNMIPNNSNNNIINNNLINNIIPNNLNNDIIHNNSNKNNPNNINNGLGFLVKLGFNNINQNKSEFIDLNPNNLD